MSATSEVQSIVRKLNRTEGVQVELNGNNHYVIYKDGERVSTFAGTPSDHRWRKNLMADLKRVGITIGERSPREVAKDRDAFLMDYLIARRYTVASLTKLLNDAGENITEAGVRQRLYKLESRGLIYRANGGRQGKEIEWRARSAVPEMPKQKPAPVEQLDPTPVGMRPWHPSMGPQRSAHVQVESDIDLAAARAKLTITLDGDLEEILALIEPLVRYSRPQPQPQPQPVAGTKLSAAS